MGLIKTIKGMIVEAKLHKIEEKSREIQDNIERIDSDIKLLEQIILKSLKERGCNNLNIHHIREAFEKYTDVDEIEDYLISENNKLKKVFGD